MGGFFALAGTASINDVFFIHQRGTRVGLWNFAVIVSVNIAPIISGYVIVDLGWRWSFWLLAISFGVLLACVAVFFPETSFDRDSLLHETPSTSTTNNLPLFSKDLKSTEKSIITNPDDQSGFAIKEQGLDYDQAPKWKSYLGVQTVSFTKQSRIIKLLVSPLTLLRHPAVIWASVMWSVTFTWVIIQGAIASQVFAAPPYNLSPTQVGNLVGLAPLIGSALGTVSSGWISDYISKKLSIRNGGVYEPEFRLWVMLPFLVTIVVGTFGLGMAIDNGLSPIVCGVFLAILNFAVGVGCTGIVTYSNDVCLERAGEAFGVTMVCYLLFCYFMSHSTR
jgi:MFS family permease